MLCQVVSTTNIKDSLFDAVVVVTDSIKSLTGPLECLQAPLSQQQKIDKSCETEGVTLTYCPDIPSNRLIYSATGPLNRDYDDVRRFQEAAEKGIKRAVQAGCKSPLLVRPGESPFPLSTRVALLGALHALYVPLDVRELKPENKIKAERLGIWSADGDTGNQEAKLVTALEKGRFTCRDIGGSDPERMAAPRVAEYVEQRFKDTCIKMNVISDLATLSKEYPLLVAVNRAASVVRRHEARVIELEYVGEGPIDTTLMIVGKGITYDTGGADIKIGGAMAGMHRDKCGAAALAGFFEVLEAYKPKGLKVMGTMAMVRNSVGAESYVADEIIVGRSGKRVRVNNTDAEGRMVMADPLCQMKERAKGEKNPHLFTIATLTGHVIRAYSEHYGAVMDNGPAKQRGTANHIFTAGETSGDMFEISTIRREDYKTHSSKTESEDCWQSGISPSTMCPRGHQSPSAFLIMASGLDKHGIDSSEPLPYTHLDVAGSSGPFPGIPTGSPVVALSHAYVLNRQSAAK